MGNRSNYSQWMFMFFFQMSISYQVNIGTILSISSLYYSQFNIPQSYGGILSHRGTPSSHPFDFRILHEINYPASLGHPHLWKPPNEYESIAMVYNLWGDEHLMTRSCSIHHQGLDPHIGKVLKKTQGLLQQNQTRLEQLPVFRESPLYGFPS